MTSDRFLPCVQPFEHEVQLLQWVKKANLTVVSELRLFLASHSMNVAQIKRCCEFPPLIPFLAEKTQSCLSLKADIILPCSMRKAQSSAARLC